MNLFVPKNRKKVRKVNINKSNIQNFEKEIYELFNQGRIPYPVHLTKGNEESLINIFHYVDKKDWVFCSWRNHAHALLHGISKKSLKSQILNGKSMYVSSKKHRFLSSSIAGGIIPISLGVALGLKRKKSKQRAWLFIGDMTSQMGLFYEAYNYSRNFNLPLEIVIEDNGKSVKTDTKKVWNLKKINFPKDVFYYKYKLAYPPFGTGKWVTFK